MERIRRGNNINKFWEFGVGEYKENQQQKFSPSMDQRSYLTHLNNNNKKKGLLVS